jgi:hypothetical protein
MRQDRWRWFNWYVLTIAAAAVVYVTLTWGLGAGASNAPLLASISLVLAVVCFRISMTEVGSKRSGAGSHVEPTGIVIDDQTPLDIGTKVLAYWRGHWWNAVVVGFDEERVIVRYVGWNETWDEPQPRSNIQLLTPARSPDADAEPTPTETRVQASQREKLRDGEPESS